MNNIIKTRRYIKDKTPPKLVLFEFWKIKLLGEGLKKSNLCKPIIL